MQMQKQGKLPLNYSEEAKVCEKCGKSPCECDKVDEREMPTKATLFKNKLRAKGIQVAGLTISPRNMNTYDELGEEVISERRKEEKSLKLGIDYKYDFSSQDVDNRTERIRNRIERVLEEETETTQPDNQPDEVMMEERLEEANYENRENLIEEQPTHSSSSFNFGN